MQGNGDQIMPYLIDEIGDILGIRIAINAETITITDFDASPVVRTENSGSMVLSE
jgi:hypothetical protein